MKTHTLLRSAGLLALPLVLAGGSSGLPAAPAAPPPPDTLNLILEELRQLRRSVELTALLQVKVQVAAERMKLREPRVRALAEQAVHVEQAQTATTVELERMQAELTKVEERIGQETAPEAQRELGAQRRALLDTMGRMSRQEEETGRQAEAIRAHLTTERSEVDRLSEVLGQLERSLERQVGAATGPERR